MRKAAAMTVLRRGTVMLALALLGGCVRLGTREAPASIITLTSTSSVPAGAMFDGPAARAVLVMEPETDKRLAVLRVPVQVNDVQVAYLQNVQWVERPARLFRALVAEELRAKGGRLVIEDDQPAAGIETRLSGRLLEMGYDARSGNVVVRYDALLTVPGGGLATHRFESVIKHVKPKPREVGPALNRAANDVAAQVAGWVAGG